MPESSDPNISRAIAERLSLVDAFEQNLPIDMLTAELTGVDINTLNGDPDLADIKPGGYFVLTAQGLPKVEDINATNLSADDLLKRNTLIETIRLAYQKVKGNDKLSDKNTTLVFPLEYNSHWYLVEINLTPTKINSVSVWDPRKKPGSLPPYNQLAKIINKATGIKSLKIQTSTVAGRQNENYSCGDWIVDEIERRLLGKSYVRASIEFLRLIHISRIFYHRLQEIKSGLGSNYENFETNVVILASKNNFDLEQTKQKIKMLVDQECLTKSSDVLDSILLYLDKESPRLSQSNFLKNVLDPKSVIEWAYAKNFFTATEIFKNLPHEDYEAASDILQQKLGNSENKNALYRLKQKLEKFEKASNRLKQRLENSENKSTSNRLKQELENLEKASNRLKQKLENFENASIILKQRFKNFKNDLREYFAYEIIREGSPLNLALIEELTKPSTPTIDVEAEIAELEAEIEVNEQSPTAEQRLVTRLGNTILSLNSDIPDEAVEPEFNNLTQQLATNNKPSTSTTTISPDSSVSQISGFEEKLGEAATQPATKNAATPTQPVQPKNQSHKPQEVENSTELVIVEFDAKEQPKETYSEPETANQAVITETDLAPSSDSDNDLALSSPIASPRESLHHARFATQLASHTGQPILSENPLPLSVQTVNESSTFEPQATNVSTVEQPIEQTESLPATQVGDNLTVTKEQTIKSDLVQTPPNSITEPEQIIIGYVDADGNLSAILAEQEQPLLGSDTTTKDSNEKVEPTYEKQPTVSNSPLKKWFNSWFRPNSNYQKLESPEPMSPRTKPKSTDSTIIIPTPVVQQIAEPSPLRSQTAKNTATVEQPTQQEVLPLQKSDSVQMPTSPIIEQEDIDTKAELIETQDKQKLSVTTKKSAISSAEKEIAQLDLTQLSDSNDNSPPSSPLTTPTENLSHSLFITPSTRLSEQESVQQSLPEPMATDSSTLDLSSIFNESQPIMGEEIEFSSPIEQKLIDLEQAVADLELPHDLPADFNDSNSQISKIVTLHNELAIPYLDTEQTEWPNNSLDRINKTRVQMQDKLVNSVNAVSKEANLEDFCKNDAARTQFIRYCFYFLDDSSSLATPSIWKNYSEYERLLQQEQLATQKKMDLSPQKSDSETVLIQPSSIEIISRSYQETTENSPDVLSDYDEDSLTEDESEEYLSPRVFRQQLLQAHGAKKYSPNTDAETFDEIREDLQDFSSDDEEDSLIEKPNSPPQPFFEAGTLALIAAARLITLRENLDKLTTIVTQFDKIKVTPNFSKIGLNLRAEVIHNKIAAFKTELVNEINSLTPFLSASIINQSQVQQRVAEFEQLTTAATQLQTQLDLSKEHHLQTLQGLINKFANDVNQIDIEINLLDLEINRFISKQIIVDPLLENNTAELEAQGNSLLDRLAQQEQAINAQLRLSNDFADAEIKTSQTKLEKLIHDVADLKAQLIIKLDLARVQAELTHLSHDFADLQTAPITPASLKQDYDEFLEKAQNLAAKIPNPLPLFLTATQQQAYQEMAEKIGQLITGVNASKNAIDQLFQQRKDSYNALIREIPALGRAIKKFVRGTVNPSQLAHLNEQAEDFQEQLETLRQQVKQDIDRLAPFADPSFATEKAKGNLLLRKLLSIFAGLSREVTKKQTTLLVAGLPLDFMRAQLTEPASYLKWYNSLGIVNLVQRTIETTRAIIPAEKIEDFEAAVLEFNTQHKLDTLQSFFKTHLTSSALYKTYLDQINDSIPLEQRKAFNQAIKAFYKTGETDGLAVFLENHLQLEIQFKHYLTILNKLPAQGKTQFNQAVLSAQKGNYQLLSEFFMANPQVRNLFSNNQDLLKQVESMWQSQRQENYKEKMQLEPQNEPRVSSYRRAHHYLGKLFDNITEEEKKLEEAAEMRGDYSASQERNAIIKNIFAAYQNGTIEEKLNSINAKSSREYEEESARDKPKATTIRGPSSN